MLIAADMQSYSLDQLQTEASSEWLRMPMGMLIALIRSLLQVIYPLLRVEQVFFYSVLFAFLDLVC
jgi:hypothetical protein